MNEQQAIDAADAYNDHQDAMSQDFMLREDFREHMSFKTGEPVSLSSLRLQTEPLKMSPLHFAEIYASSATLWDIAKEYEEILRKQHRVGRNRECKVADMMVYQLLENQLLSSRAVERFLHDKRNWNVIVDAAKKSWPDNPERRLSSEPPTRFQFMRLRDALYKKIPGFHKVFDADGNELIKTEELLANIRDEHEQVVTFFTDAIYSKTNNYPAALRYACSLLVSIKGSEFIRQALELLEKDNQAGK